MSKLLIWGTGGHSLVVGEAAEAYYSDIVYMDDNHPDFHNNSWLEKYNPLQYYAFPAIGNNKDRSKVLNRLAFAGFKIPNIVHKSAIISRSASLTRGIYIGPQVVIQAQVAIGAGVIINTLASVDHDSHIGIYTHIAPNAVCCGHVKVGEYCLIGAGASVIPHVIIENNCTIGAGAAVIDPVVYSGSLMLGVPARQVNRVSESG